MSSGARWVLVGLAIGTGCGGDIEPSGGIPDASVGKHDAAFGPDASVGKHDAAVGREVSVDGEAGSTGCADAAPTFDASCDASLGLLCEYGASPSPPCNVLAVCDTVTGRAGLTWQSPETAIECPATGPCPGYGNVAVDPMGPPCTQSFCSYPQGTCYGCVGWYGITCVPLTPGCPPIRPRIGSACSAPTPDCDYGTCLGEGQSLSAAVTCRDGRWFWLDENLECDAGGGDAEGD